MHTEPRPHVKTGRNAISLPNGQDYAVLRLEGLTPDKARAQLGLGRYEGGRMERVLQARTRRGAGEGQVPRFARHEAHCAAVMAEGGFWALSEQRKGKDQLVVCLPLLPPPRG
jgi:hypothetical protein